MRSRVIYVVTWALAVAVATAVGLAAVGMVGDAVRGRGPLGGEVQPADAAPQGSEQDPRPDPDAELISREISGDFGTFMVSCQGLHAIVHEVRADAAAGWRVVRFEPGPDDEVDAVFSNRRSLVDIEVFCNGGQPTVAETEKSRLPHRD